MSDFSEFKHTPPVSFDSDGMWQRILFVLFTLGNQLRLCNPNKYFDIID